MKYHYSSKVKKAVIPAAGFGTRFLPQTKAMPKEMALLILSSSPAGTKDQLRIILIILLNWKKD